MEKHCESEKRFGKEGNDTEAMNEILDGFIRESGGRAYQFAYSLAGNDEEAHDLVQEALYRVVMAWERYETLKPLDRWFFTILHNAFIDSRRRFEGKHGVSLDCPLGGQDGPSYGDRLASKEEGIQQALERKESMKQARRTLRRLGEEHREVLTLCDMMGHRYDDIAVSLKVPIGTVRSRIHRAREAFRGQWSAIEAVA
mgnify:CR=1 FL=1